MKWKARFAVLALTACLTAGAVQAATPVREQDDFYQAVNGPTLAKKEIRPTEASWSWFSERSLENKRHLKEDLKKIAQKQGTYQKGSPEQKIADLYACVTDTKKRNATARPHLEKLVQPVKNAKNLDELSTALHQVSQQTGTDVFVGYSVDRLPTGLTYVPRIITVTPALTRDELQKETQPGTWHAYENYVADILQAAGEPKEAAQKHGRAILTMEKKLGPYLLTSEQRNDVKTYNHLVSQAELVQDMPHLGGKKVLRNLDLLGEKQFFLANPAYLRQFDSLYVPENLELLKSYALFQVYDGFAPFADLKLRNLQRDYQRQRFGVAKARSEEETASRLVQNLLAYEFGQIYLKNHAQQETFADVRQMVDKIRAVYKKRLEKNTWLSQKTRQKAIEKLAHLRVFVGGPAKGDKPLLESMPDVLPPDQSDLLANIMHNGVLEKEEVHALLGTSFNPDKWYAFDPQDVNAAYIPENNSITIPAGILQPPFYEEKASYGTNLGGIGMVIGHEISHAFDPNGSQYDSEGRLKNWWTRADYAAFQKLAQAFGPYYDTYALGDNLHENGKLVSNEAIADCGGLSVVSEIAAGDEAALRALYHNFAAIFASKMTTQLLTYLVQNDPHPTGPARVNGALSATDGFYQAYAVKAGDGMYIAPQKRVHLW